MEEREARGGSLHSGLFIGRFFIFIGLVIHGALSAPLAVSEPLLSGIVDFRRLNLIALSSLFLGIGLFRVLDLFTPKIQFMGFPEIKMKAQQDIDNE